MPAHPQELGPFTFETPASWSRRTILLYGDTAAAPGRGPNVLVTRDERGPGEDLRAYAWRRLFEIARAAPARQLVDSRPTKICDRAAFRAVMQWTTELGIYRETIVWVDAGEDNALVLTCTSLEDEGLDAFERLLAGLRYGAAPPVSTTIPTPLPSAPRSTPPPPDYDAPPMYPGVPMPGARAMRR